MENELLFKKMRLVIVVVALVAIGAMISTVLVWFKLQEVQSGGVEVDAELTKIVADVGDFMILPEGETPELLTVSNLDQVKGQPFFANAQLGDKVLIYKKASKAVLWRPSINKIVEVYPITIGAQ